MIQASISTQGQRDEAAVAALAALRLALGQAHGADAHLTSEQAATPRHGLPFRVTLHLDVCERCARQSVRRGGAWRYAPRKGDA